MKRSLFVSVLLLSAASAALGQAPRQKADRGIVLEGEQKMRYITKQLSLNEKQQKDTDALIAVYNTMMEEETSQAALIRWLGEFQVMMTELEEAKKAGDTKRVDELKNQIEATKPGMAPEKQFFESLEATLDADQKVKLTAARQRIANNPDVTLTPHDVVEAARAQKLEDAQRTKLDDLLKEYRADMAKARPSTLEDRIKSVDELIGKVRTVLNPEQTKAFDAEIERLRPPAPADLKPVQLQMPKQPRVIVKEGNVREVEDPAAEVRKVEIKREVDPQDLPPETEPKEKP
ncbi:MAG: hypothetical protein AB7N71_00990 [Phycisphaerae bacterium]